MWGWILFWTALVLVELLIRAGLWMWVWIDRGGVIGHTCDLVCQRNVMAHPHSSWTLPSVAGTSQCSTNVLNLLNTLRLYNYDVGCHGSESNSSGGTQRQSSTLASAIHCIFVFEDSFSAIACSLYLKGLRRLGRLSWNGEINTK